MVFDKFSQLVVTFFRKIMSTVTNGLILKKTKLWSELYKIRLEATILQIAWKEPLIALELPCEDEYTVVGLQ